MTTEAETVQTVHSKQEIQLTAMQEAMHTVSATLEFAIRECGVVAVRDQPAFMQAVRMAHGIKMIRNALTKEFIEESIVPLQNTKLGFLTDKPDGYDWKTVRDVLAEALMRGFRPVNNEFNIIAGGFYGAKNGFERIVLEWSGLRNLQIDFGVPKLIADKGALVPCVARWMLEGEFQELYCGPPRKEGDIDTSIPVRVNSGMGPDAILGKATRKMNARIYQRLTGCAAEIIDAEGESIPTENLPALAAPAQDGQRIKMNGSKKTEADQSR